MLHLWQSHLPILYYTGLANNEQALICLYRLKTWTRRFEQVKLFFNRNKNTRQPCTTTVWKQKTKKKIYHELFITKADRFKTTKITKVWSKLQWSSRLIIGYYANIPVTKFYCDRMLINNKRLYMLLWRLLLQLILRCYKLDSSLGNVVNMVLTLYRFRYSI